MSKKTSPPTLCKRCQNGSRFRYDLCRLCRLCDARQWAQELLAFSFVVLDVETTGLDCEEDEILQIGIVSSGGEVLLDTLVRPEEAIYEADSACVVNGITNAMVADAPTFRQVHTRLYTLLHGKIIVAYNIAFDWPMLAGNCERHELPMPRAARLPCAMETFAQVYGEMSHSRGYRGYKYQSLARACAHFGIVQEKAHTGCGDALATLELIRALGKIQNLGS